MSKRYVVINGVGNGYPPNGSVLEWSSHFAAWSATYPDGRKSLYLGNPECYPDTFRQLDEFKPVKRLKKRCQLD